MGSLILNAMTVCREGFTFVWFKILVQSCIQIHVFVCSITSSSSTQVNILWERQLWHYIAWFLMHSTDCILSKIRRNVWWTTGWQFCLAFSCIGDTTAYPHTLYTHTGWFGKALKPIAHGRHRWPAQNNFPIEPDRKFTTLKNHEIKRVLLGKY